MPGQQREPKSGDRVDSARLDAALDIETQLPSQEEILRFERSTRSHRQSQPLERITNQGEEDSEAGAHGRIVPRSQHFVIILTNCIRYRNNCGLHRVLLRKTKNGQPRVIWVHGEALRLLKEHGKVHRLDDDHVFLGATPRSRYDYHTPFKAACAAAGVRDFRFHDLRHSAATYLAREGATEQQLKAIGGWKSNVVSRYVHLAAEDAKAVLERMNAKILGNGAVGNGVDDDR